jgi:hypothetical protein
MLGDVSIHFVLSVAVAVTSRERLFTVGMDLQGKTKGINTPRVNKR